MPLITIHYQKIFKVQGEVITVTPREYLELIEKTWKDAADFQKNVLESYTYLSKILSQFNVMNSSMAVFRAKVQSGGRISIPEVDRAILNLKDGDIVKVIVVKEKGGDGDGV